MFRKESLPDMQLYTCLLYLMMVYAKENLLYHYIYRIWDNF